jgi:hypothetical protein
LSIGRVEITGGSTAELLYAYRISGLTHQLMDLGPVYAYRLPDGKESFNG